MKSKTTETILQRLIAVDSALAAGNLHTGRMAEEFNVSDKTIKRDVAALAALIGPTAARMVKTDDNPIGHTYLHGYVDRRRRVFSASVAH